jgi:enoyl-CoA hydratase/carnithine racemase
MGDELTSLSNDGRIATEKSGHIFLIVIDRPKKLNGFSVKMLSELGQAFSAMEDDSDIRCGVLCAEGRNFTAGLELNQIAKHLAEGPLFPKTTLIRSTCAAGSAPNLWSRRFRAFASHSGSS